jgi:hypothetical protein
MSEVSERFSAFCCISHQGTEDWQFVTDISETSLRNYELTERNITEEFQYYNDKPTRYITIKIFRDICHRKSKMEGWGEDMSKTECSMQHYQAFEGSDEPPYDKKYSLCNFSCASEVWYNFLGGNNEINSVF